MALYKWQPFNKGKEIAGLQIPIYWMFYAIFRLGKENKLKTTLMK
jgi:hypothetical protein